MLVLLERNLFSGSTTLQWIAFRFFFIESFLRTIIFQTLKKTAVITVVFVPFIISCCNIVHWSLCEFLASEHIGS